jgi:hypothetical protein
VGLLLFQGVSNHIFDGLCICSIRLSLSEDATLYFVLRRVSDGVVVIFGPSRNTTTGKPFNLDVIPYLDS